MPRRLTISPATFREKTSVMSYWIPLPDGADFFRAGQFLATNLNKNWPLPVSAQQMISSFLECHKKQNNLFSVPFMHMETFLPHVAF
jgi:hypothetical protein